MGVSHGEAEEEVRAWACVGLGQVPGDYVRTLQERRKKLSVWRRTHDEVRQEEHCLGANRNKTDWLIDTGKTSVAITRARLGWLVLVIFTFVIREAFKTWAPLFRL